MLSMLTKLSDWKALIVIFILGAVGIFAKGFKIVKVIAWGLVALVAVCASWNEIKS